MLLIDTLLIGAIAIGFAMPSAIATYQEKTANVEQTELIPVPVSDEEKAQKTNS